MITLAKLRGDLFSYVDAEEDSDKTEYFYTAANKALDYVHSNFPERYTARHVIDGAEIDNVIAGGNDPLVVAGSPLTLTGKGKAYYFETQGVGSFKVITNGTETVTDFDNSEYTPYRGFLQGDSRIEFYGDYQFYIRGAAIYNQLLSADIIDIPEYSASIEYDFKELTRQGTYYPFCSFMEAKFEEVGNDGEWHALNDYEIVPNKEGHILRLPRTTSQKVIYYKRHFIEVTVDSTEIDIPTDLYYAFLEQFYAEYLIDENEVSVDRAGFNYRTKVSLKQSGKSAENPIQMFINERF